MRSRTKAGAARRQDSQLPMSRPSHTPKVAPSGSASRAARPGGREIGPTAVVPPRSRTRAAASSALGTAKYGVQATTTCHIVATAAMPATGTSSASAMRNRSPSCAWRHRQPNTAP